MQYVRGLFFIICALGLVSFGLVACGAKVPPTDLVLELYVDHDSKLRADAFWSSDELLSYSTSSSGSMAGPSGNKLSYVLQDDDSEFIRAELTAKITADNVMTVEGTVQAASRVAVHVLGVREDESPVIIDAYEGDNPLSLSEKVIFTYDNE